MMRIPRLLCSLLVPVLSLPAAPALAGAPLAPDAAMLKPIQEWIAAYNAGTGPLPEEIFTQDVVITDEFAPFTWTGSSGEHRWAEAIDSFMKPGQQHASAGAARRFQSTKSGDRVSFVLPATLTISHGKRKFTESAFWFYVLVKTPDGWKIATDTWTPIGK